LSLDRIRRFMNKMLKVGKWFTVLKTINHFLKIKEEFSVKGKVFSVDYCLMSHQTTESSKNILYKSFYDE
jgi:hypothetical protein